MKLFLQTYQDKQMRVFLTKLSLQENDGAIIFLIAEKEQKTILNFSLNSLIVSE